MTSSALMPARCTNGSWIRKRRTSSSSPEFLMKEPNVTSLRRSLLHQTVVLLGRSRIDRHWMLLRGPNIRTPTTKNPGSPFGDLPSSPITRPAREHNKGLKRSAETDLPLPLTGPIPVNRDSVAKTRSPKVLSPLAPLTEKVGGGGVGGGGGGGGSGSGRGEASPFQGHLDKTISPTSRDSAESFSRYLDCLWRRPPITSSLPVGVTKQQQNSRPPSRCSETWTFAGHRGGDGHYVAGLLQPPISSPETRRFFQSHHRLEEVESVHCSSIVQNGDPILHYSSPSTTEMDHKDRLEGCIPSHYGPCQHPQILPVRCSRDSLSIPGPPVWTINSSKGIHQDSSPCDPAASLSRHPGPRLLGRLDNSCHFSRTESGTYTTHYTTSTITGMDNQLGQINVTTLPNPGLPGFTFQLRTSPHISSGLVLTNSHRGPIPSISVDGHVCSKSFIHHQPDVTFCPIHIQRPSSSTVSPVLVKKTVDSTSAVVGHSNPVGCGLPLLPALVSTANSDDRCSVTSSVPQSVLFHGCISQRLGSQLERQSDFRTMVNSRLSTSYQLVGIRSNPTCTTSVGSSVETSDCESLLRQQYSSSVHPQTGGNTFSAPILQNSGTVRAPGSVCDNSHTYTPPRSQEPIVLKTLQKIQKSRGTTVIMIASQHPSRPWHPLLLQLSTRPRISLQDVQLFQYVPNRRRPQYHRDPRLLDLAAWNLSGTS